MPAAGLNAAIIDVLRGRLIVSCQMVAGGPMDDSRFVVGFALAALAGGAAGLRIEGVANVAAVRAATGAPVIGLVKRREPDSDVFITPRPADVVALTQAGASIVAFDATLRARPDSVAALIAATHDAGAIAMADIASIEDAQAALAAGADIIGTTLSGYIGGPVPDAPDFSLIAACAALGSRPVFAEGRIKAPAQAAAAIAHGAAAVVVGSAITRVEHIAGWFAHAIAAAA